MKSLWTVYLGLLAGLVASLATTAAWALERTAEPLWAVSEDGAYVMTASGHLAWPRCVEGMHWSGKTCIGEPLLVDYSGAIALIGARKKADGGRWRLPRTAELQRFVEHSRHPGALEQVLFPDTVGGWYWASTASVNTAPINQYSYANAMQGRTNQNANRLAFLHGWAVNMETGAARGDVSKRTKLPVRLVLSQD